MADTLTAEAVPTPRPSIPAARAVADVAVETVGLTKRYGDKVAVDRLNLRIPRGEVFGLLGPNGAGKTTTILMLLGLTEPTAGNVRVDGLDPSRDALAVKRRVGYLPDDVGFYDELTGRQNLSYTAALNRLPRREAAERVAELLEVVGLVEVADRKVRGYSRGMRQRLGLADALVKRPTILILDEPTVNIDPRGVHELLDVVTRLRAEQGVTVLLSSHLLHQVEQVCDRIGIFVDGRLVAAGTVEELVATVADRWIIDLVAEDGDGPTNLSAALLAVPGVDALDRDGTHWHVRARRDVRADLARAVTASGGNLVHLARQGADLDAIYHRYFRGVPVDDGDDRAR
jgi:ABC-2 type transport system ATP-binding protein